jgi:hypothetical protein
MTGVFLILGCPFDAGHSPTYRSFEAVPEWWPCSCGAEHQNTFPSSEAQRLTESLRDVRQRKDERINELVREVQRLTEALQTARAERDELKGRIANALL